MGNVCGCDRNTYGGTTTEDHPTGAGLPIRDTKEEPNRAPTTSTVELHFDVDEDLESEDIEDDEVDVLPTPSPNNMAKPRQSVSAEAYGKWNKKEHFNPPMYPKTEEQKERLQKTLGNSFLFNSLEKDDLETVILAFQEKKIIGGTTIIQQGDDGDRLYVIEEGTVDVYKKKESDTEPVKLCQLVPGDTFGELALMYNAPRAATVIATPQNEEDSESPKLTLWALDRGSFNAIVKDAAARKRELYESALMEVSLLKDMDPYERSKVADALRSEIYDDKDVIIREGEEGDTFYILIEGEAEAVKEDKVVLEYKIGDYFGELALLKNQPRAATVRAKGRCKIIFLDRKSFKRLLGPVEVVLARTKENYIETLHRMGMDASYLEK